MINSDGRLMFHRSRSNRTVLGGTDLWFITRFSCTLSPWVTLRSPNNNLRRLDGRFNLKVERSQSRREWAAQCNGSGWLCTKILWTRRAREIFSTLSEEAMHFSVIMEIRISGLERSIYLLPMALIGLEAQCVSSPFCFASMFIVPISYLQ